MIDDARAKRCHTAFCRHDENRRRAGATAAADRLQGGRRRRPRFIRRHFGQRACRRRRPTYYCRAGASSLLDERPARAAESSVFDIDACRRPSANGESRTCAHMHE